MASNSPAAIEAVLRRAELARTNNFDLLQEAGYTALRTELAADFPYLTLADLNAIIKLGIKGKLDTYKARTLNFTRVYQWVEQRAVFSLGYWQAKHPALCDWAEMTGTTARLLNELDTYETPAPAFAQPHKFRQLLQKVVRKHYAPRIDFNSFTTYALLEQYPEEAAEMAFVEQVLYPQFLDKYPELTDQHQAIF